MTGASVQVGFGSGPGSPGSSRSPRPTGCFHSPPRPRFFARTGQFGGSEEALGTFVLMTTFGLNIISGSRATAYSASAVLMCMMLGVQLDGGGFFILKQAGEALVDQNEKDVKDQPSRASLSASH